MVDANALDMRTAAQLQLTVQRPALGAQPSDAQLYTWISRALAQPDPEDWRAGLTGDAAGSAVVEITVRIVDIAESADLNLTYREKPGPTNVLAFPFDAPPGVAASLLGDIVICGALVESEAAAQHKLVSHHWAHLAIHGTLHLLGYDHIAPAQAVLMEHHERCILQSLSIADPYEYHDG